ncbi:carboxylesterase/lipase family protein [Cryobacterium sp. TMT1-21]|uniref:Carboxylic ester hydrolase n=1 Tax=Cryobacterium shii TaxID=1259235 RepID=A0AAQ2C7W4_9MICO|nr:MULTISPECIES: carboxylesterase/lipase family protein [Cryobacterium]TFC51277.1 carboxylesterase/lipase family protein [Cryobacterium shii]TFC85211.1 carboxylesterase/lipase family protein [Cryobacterium sp. TmT2-59]TFD15841.1 carboxylesterase/lipase family protein [Cryobacterium sp. TMT4-10]TFD17105.1 carboxylesterase/lipase family protein [Cryobacterium sp. TMT1-21]TFD26224.1 carboxylesterase/lipase family protein [Cryobacterium sp. TMT2-23]
MIPSAQPTRTDPLEVRVGAGVVRGVRERGVRAWRGIPYAAAPVGQLRFRAPQPAGSWPGVRDAGSFGPVATQSHRGQFIGAHPRIPQSEDCLNLNVLAPDEPDASVKQAGPAGRRPLRPVMVFVHGGAYSVGSSREVPRQGEGLVRRGGIVYVSINYRLGALGYLDFSRYSTPERPFESNLGLRDQVAALEWVRDNIASFGGDPDAVTLFGESAGGNAVTTLMTVPAAAGLFHRAIAQSAPPNAVYSPEITAEWAGDFVSLLARRSGAAGQADPGQPAPDPAALLIAADPARLAEATTDLTRRAPDRYPGTIPLSPVIDGDFLPERPLDAFRDGRAHRVPLIIGTNAREGSLFSGRIDILATTPKRISAVFGNTRKKARKALKAQYPGIPALRPALDFGGDFSFWYPSVRVGERHSRYAPVHFYRFDAAPRLLRAMGLDATHGLELFPLFDRLDGWPGRGMTALGGRRQFQAVGRRMQDWWLAFAATGSPDAAWPRYDEVDRQTLIIDSVDRIESDPLGGRRRAWGAFVPHI